MILEKLDSNSYIVAVSLNNATLAVLPKQQLPWVVRDFETFGTRVVKMPHSFHSRLHLQQSHLHSYQQPDFQITHQPQPQPSPWIPEHSPSPPPLPPAPPATPEPTPPRWSGPRSLPFLKRTAVPAPTPAPVPAQAATAAATAPPAAAAAQLAAVGK
ncbi:hypothetical protein VTL71DRAFT_13560 [Oculimacula yallundae]|uniref:Uncharacterized protein n=1 Tax=Oculimacula yallundae TaxID=86028 RepID=A0ABR4CN80_9HELO